MSGKVYRFGKYWIAGIVFVGIVVAIVTLWRQPSDSPSVAHNRFNGEPRALSLGIVYNWWDAIPEGVRSASVASGEHTNIHPGDYIGPEACGKCHPKNHELWSGHAHRLMNAIATPETVLGDFSGDASVSYLGGVATFFSQDDGWRMQLVRDGVRRTYEIHQTIGSRFFQYYNGVLIDGPEPAAHEYRNVDHLLPFGYWLDRREWIPIVHVHDRANKGDGTRADPFISAPGGLAFSAYTNCSTCHTTYPLGLTYLRSQFSDPGHDPPVHLHFMMSDFLADEYPSFWNGDQSPDQTSGPELESLTRSLRLAEAPDHAAVLGISCEACHLGGREHANGRLKKPRFTPGSPHLMVETAPVSPAVHALDAESSVRTSERSHSSLNWTCGRCHAGTRPQFAAGMSTWNSTEYTDAMRGSCYSQLRCIDCHSPHEGIGSKWALTPDQNDALCLKCHQQFEPHDVRQAHTHHPIGSEGSRCMNCHMPHLNEGLQDVVRTHTIFSPSDARMIESNQPNACNQCHTDKSIGWTVGHLEDWYGAKFHSPQIAANYRDSKAPAALNWLKNANQAVRMVAVDSLTRRNDRSALPQLIDALDDPYLLNRQFARIGLERMLDVKLSDFGYQYYMTPDERREPLQRLRNALLQ